MISIVGIIYSYVTITMASSSLNLGSTLDLECDTGPQECIKQYKSIHKRAKGS